MLYQLPDTQSAKSLQSDVNISLLVLGAETDVAIFLNMFFSAMASVYFLLVLYGGKNVCEVCLPSVSLLYAELSFLIAAQKAFS
jgi:hypothetical protein